MAAVPPRRRYAVGANTGVRRAIEVNKRQDDLQEIIDATLREMAAEGRRVRPIGSLAPAAN